jgi:AcrR family transcriptional regulator
MPQGVGIHAEIAGEPALSQISRREAPVPEAVSPEAAPLQARPADGLAAEALADSAKRRQILEGARRIFRARGFDGASMGEIAKSAGVSKGTLYVYFESKELLFEALVIAERRETAEQLFHLDVHDPDVKGVLRRLGRSFLAMMVRPEHIATVRMVMGAAEKFPRIGRAFYAAGPHYGMTRLAGYLATQVEAGRLGITDTERAAHHFLDLCQGGLTKALFFGVTAPPSPRTIEETVEAAIDVFFAAYGPRPRLPAGG